MDLARVVPRAHHEYGTWARSGADEDVRRSRRTVNEVPGPEAPLLLLDDQRALAVQEMENAMQLSVPLVVDVGRGANWDEAH